MLFFIIIAMFAFVLLLKDESKKALKEAKEDFKRITGCEYN